MTLTLYPVPGKAKSDMICRAFAASAPKSAKGAVFFGTEGQMTAFERAKASGEPWFYIDNSYFDKHRGLYFRVTKNALQVDPRGKTSDGKRFAKLGVPIKPWLENPSGDILLVPQSDQFMKSTMGVTFDWTSDVQAALEYWGFSHVRVHPWDRDKLKRNTAFAEMLPTTRLVITHASAAAITALLEGVPAISTSPTAAAFRIGGLFISEDVETPSRPSYEERLQFANILADNQFTLEEFRNGSVWQWLKN